MVVVPDQSAAVSLEALRRAARGLEGIAVRTPLVDLPALSDRLGVEVKAKCEQFQPVGAFKIRGAYTAISRLPPEIRSRGVITYSSGNHGQAVAFAARLLGIGAVVVMPEGAPGIKVEGVRKQGAEVVFAGKTSADRLDRALALADERGLTVVPPYESLDVIAGQGTCGLEILEAWPPVETILVPVGGGGLIAGIAAAIAALKPTVRVIGVEPTGAAKLARALEAGHPTNIEFTGSLADGLLPLSVGKLAFAVLSGVVSEAVQVTDDEIATGVAFLYDEKKLIVEPSGAVTTAALLTGRIRPTGPTAVVISGGNVDPHLFQRLVHPFDGLRACPEQREGAGSSTSSGQG